jgi:hypothetical protein
MTPKPDPQLLPKWFVRPEPMARHHDCLFRSPLQKVLAEMRISADEVLRWRAGGWLSFDGVDSPELGDFDDPRVWELTVVRDIVRSGLPDAQVECLLSQLPRPFSLNPDRLAFSFRHGWVEAVPPEEPDPEEPDPDAIIEVHLDSWLEGCDEEQLLELRDRIGQVIEDFVENTAEDGE